MWECLGEASGTGASSCAKSMLEEVGSGMIWTTI